MSQVEAIHFEFIVSCLYGHPPLVVDAQSGKEITQDNAVNVVGGRCLGGRVSKTGDQRRLPEKEKFDRLIQLRIDSLEDTERVIHTDAAVSGEDAAKLFVGHPELLGQTDQ